MVVGCLARLVQRFVVSWLIGKVLARLFRRRGARAE